MLWKASDIKGYAIAASDGHLGKVSDFLFDDASWRMRWLVVDTGKWLSDRKVLIPPSALGRLDRDSKEFSVKLTMRQIKDSPGIDADQPVSRQMETSIYDYYGWSPYWGTGFSMGGYGYAPPFVDPAGRETDIADTRKDSGDPHLRSVRAVIGYHIHASDGEIGHVEDFLVADADWSIHYLVVDTKNWWPGKKVLISPRSALEIDWMDRMVSLSVDRQLVMASPVYDASKAIDPAAEENHYHHHDSGMGPGDRP